MAEIINYFEQVARRKSERIKSYKQMIRKAKKEKRPVARYRRVAAWIPQNIHYSSSVQPVRSPQEILQEGRGTDEEIAILTAYTLATIGEDVTKLKVVRGRLKTPYTTSSIGHTICGLGDKDSGTWYFCYVYGLSKYPTEFKPTENVMFETILPTKEDNTQHG